MSIGIKDAEHGNGAGDTANPQVFRRGEDDERFRGDDSKGGNKEEIDKRPGEYDSQPVGTCCNIMGERSHGRKTKGAEKHPSN